MTRRLVATLVCLQAFAFVACSDDGAETTDDVGGVLDASDATDGAVEPDTAESDTAEPDVGDPDATAPFGPLECPPAPDLDPQTFDVEGWRVTLGVDGRWSVAPPHAPDAPVLRGAGTCAADDDVGTRFGVLVGRGEPGVYNDFGAFDIELVEDSNDLIDNPPDIEEFRPVSAARVDNQEGAPQLTWAIDDGELALRFSAHGDGNLRIGIEAPGFTSGMIRWESAEDEGFFGLGTQAFGMNLRGGRFPLWTQEQGNSRKERRPFLPLENFLEAAYAPMGVWHGSAGYAAIVDHDGFHEVDLAESHPDRVALRSYPELPAFVLVRGETPAERLTAVTEYTGRLIEEVPDWTFGAWNDAVGSPERLDEVADVLRENNVPSSAIWSEDWIGGEQTANGYRLTYAWEWSADAYPDLPTQIEALHAQGFAFLGYFNSFVPQPTRMWTEGVEGGWLIEGEDGEVRTFSDPAFRTATLIDLLDPDAVAWMQAYMVRAASEVGLDGWMADFTEWLPVDVVFEDGSDPWLTHNRYPLLYQAANTAAMREAHASSADGEENWTYFARSGWASTRGGTSGVAPVMWGGDQDTDWDDDDGIPTVVPIAVNAGLAGVGLFATDIAGYSSLTADNTTKELFYRWSTLGALHPVMRTHHGSDECGNWAFDRDADTLEHYRRWARFHVQLLPLWRALEDDARRFGWPAMRHPHLVEPDARALWEAEDPHFFVGNDLLVAPVIDEGAIARDVVLPGAGWWPIFGDAPVEGSGPRAIDAPVTELPMFVRPGTAFLAYAEAADTYYPNDAPELAGADEADAIWLAALYPDEDGRASGAIGAGPLGGGPRGAVEVDATGVRAATDFTGATWTPEGGDAVPLGACEDGAPCADASTVRTVGDGVLEAGEATIRVSAGDRELRIAVAGDAWGALALPTPVGELAPDIPPPCEEETEGRE